MEIQLFEVITEQMKQNKSLAMVMITKIEGSTPRKEGSAMALLEDGRTIGTIGGGTLEIVATKKAEECIKEGKSKAFHFQLNDDEGSLHMKCGGTAEVFIKVFAPRDKLLIVGGGHIALELYQLGSMMGFHTVIFEDREEYVSPERFPKADELILGPVDERLGNYSVNENCYIVIITRGHRYDESALRSVINSNARYIGMIGSKNKTQYVMDQMRSNGIAQDRIDRVYSPIGIALGGETPVEIAFSIMAEIMLVKNNGRLTHMKNGNKKEGI